MPNQHNLKNQKYLSQLWNICHKNDDIKNFSWIFPKFIFWHINDPNILTLRPQRGIWMPQITKPFDIFDSVFMFISWNISQISGEFLFFVDTWKRFVFNLWKNKIQIGNWKKFRNIAGFLQLCEVFSDISTFFELSI